MSWSIAYQGKRASCLPPNQLCPKGQKETLLLPNGHVYVSKRGTWRRLQTPNSFLFRDLENETTYQVNVEEGSVKKTLPYGKVLDCTQHALYEVDGCQWKLICRLGQENVKNVTECTSLAFAETTARISVIGTNPHVLPYSQIPAKQVTFSGQTATVKGITEDCAVLVYAACLKGKPIIVTQLFFRASAGSLPSLRLTTNATPFLLDLTGTESGQITFTNCVTNTSQIPLTNVFVDGLITVSGTAEITSLVLPPECLPVGSNGYSCGPFTLASGQTKCFVVVANLTCTKSGLSALTNSVTASSAETLAVSANTSVIVNCLEEPCPFLNCPVDSTCGNLFPCPPSPGPTFIVDPLLPPGPTTFNSIQQAINAASAGTIIRVANGADFVEDIVFGTGKDNILLISEVPLGATFGSGNPGGISATIDGASCVKIIDFRIFFTSDPLGIGISGGINVINGGSATIIGNTIFATDAPINNGQIGIGINVETGSAALILDNIITDYQSTGIRVNGLGACANILNNTVTGIGPTSIVTQNGIQISRGASAILQGNTVTNNQYTGADPVFSGGILLFELEANQVCVEFGNVSNNNNVGLFVVDVQGSIVQGNEFSENTAYGIYTSSDSAGNDFIRNLVINNGIFDLFDDSNGMGTGMTANTYCGNTCNTDNRGGALCGVVSTLPTLRGVYLRESVPAIPPIRPQ